jgi:hypothetical protein
MERPDVYLGELGDSWPLLATTILEIFCLLVFNVSSVFLTKYVSSLFLAVYDVTRTVIIWIVGIAITVTIGRSEANYSWEST